jgi:hypothetical protein
MDDSHDNIARLNPILCWAGAVLFAAAFFVFTYNSGYGYDAVEYLVVGRSLLDGYSVFAFSPSKSPGIFYVIAAFLRAFPQAGHVEVSALITVILFVVLGCLYFLVWASHGRGAACLSAALCAAAACFMEMNFLETEGFVVLLSLSALPALRNGVRSGSVFWIALAGLCIGAAAFFKSVALFYLLGAMAFVLLWNVLQPSYSWPTTLKLVAALWGGALAAVVAPAAYYGPRAEAKAYFFWSYVYPALHYPSDTVYAAKLWTKLGWFWAALAASVLTVGHPRVRSALRMTAYPAASLALGLSALFPLLKNQASHYVFPAAAFLSIFMGIAWAALAAAYPRSRAVFYVLGLTAAFLAAGSIWAYRPFAFRRLLTLRDYRDEAVLARHLQMLVPEEHTMLCLSHPLPYWLAHRYPPVPATATHVHFAHLLESNRSLLTDALDDPLLSVVEFDPGWTKLRAPQLQTAQAHEEILKPFAEKLQHLYQPIEIPGSKFRFWVRSVITSPSSASP